MNTHIIYISRFFTGLFESIRKARWNPTGVPTVYRFVEKWSRRYRIIWIIVCRTKEESAVINDEHRKMVINNISIHVLPYNNILDSCRLSSFVNDLLGVLYCIRISASIERKIFYVDAANVVLAAILKLFLKTPVVVRILGIKPPHKDMVKGVKHKLLMPIQCLSHKAPYDLVVCTQDGSGVEYYLDKLFVRKTPKKILLNGVDKMPQIKKRRVSDKVSLLFVGKLTDEKGILELIDAVTALRTTRNNFELKVIGKGRLDWSVRNIVSDRKLATHVKLIGSVNHADIYEHYANADIYISLNKIGGLSNTVLEAMSAGKCVVLLGKDERAHSDVYTEKVIPDDIVIRIDRGNIVQDLAERLSDLCEKPDEIKIYSDRMRKFAGEFLWSWDERIEYEIGMLKQVARGEKILTRESDLN